MALAEAPFAVLWNIQFFLLCSTEHKKKNWLFSDTPDGSSANALYLTIVEMAKAYGLNLYKYLKYLLEHRPNRDMTDDELSKLAPWNEDVQKKCCK